jgi:DNA-directed RNA polymerase specialized sigma24 family protein
MKTELSVSGSSGRLAQFYAATGSEASDHLNYLLQSEVRPILASSVKRRLSSLSRSSSDLQQEVEDIVQDGIVRVAQQLLAGRDGEMQIKSLGGYAARVAEYACDEFFRATYRKRYNAMKRVLVNLRENPAFYEWKVGPSARHGALSAWPPPPPTAQEKRANAIRLDLNVTTALILRAYWKGEAKERPGTAHCMNASLIWAEGSLDVDDLVLVLQSARNEFDEPETVLDPEMMAAPPTVAAWTEIDFLRAIWNEIRKLRPGPAKALLLNLRIKGEFGIELFAESGAARADEIADLLGFEPDHFEKEVLNELPWSDKRVAAYLNCTEDQVSALRSAARRTLANHLIASKQFPDECFRFHL